jgi:hypothetical protein
MNWDAIGAIGEIVGAVAVVTSLVYLAVQIRVSSGALRTGTRDSAFHALMKWNQDVMADPELVWIYQAGSKDIGCLDEIQRMRFGHIMYSFFKLFENLYLHVLDGSVEEDVWTYNQAMLISYANQPGAQEYLGKRKEIFDPRFWGFLEKNRTTDLLPWSEKAGLVE